MFGRPSMRKSPRGPGSGPWPPRRLGCSRQPRVRLCTVKSSLRTGKVFAAKSATVRSTEPLELRQAALLPLIQRNVVRVALQSGVGRCKLTWAHPDLAVRRHVHWLGVVDQLLAVAQRCLRPAFA